MSRRSKLCPLTLQVKRLRVFQLVLEAQGMLIRKTTGGIQTGVMCIGLHDGRTTGELLEMWRSPSNSVQSLKPGVSQSSHQSLRLLHLVLGKEHLHWSLHKPSRSPCLILCLRVAWQVFLALKCPRVQGPGIRLASQGSLTTGHYTLAPRSERLTVTNLIAHARCAPMMARLKYHGLAEAHWFYLHVWFFHHGKKNQLLLSGWRHTRGADLVTGGSFPLLITKRWEFMNYLCFYSSACYPWFKLGNNLQPLCCYLDVPHMFLVCLF